MADERKIGAVEIDRLYDFLDGLQASGYIIDPRQYLALSDLLMALIARGYSLDELPLKTLIAPLICSTPAEQQDFYQRFDRWYPTLFPVKQASLSGDGIVIHPPKRRWGFPTINRTTVIWITVVVAVIALIVWLISNSTATGTQVINSAVSLYGAIFAVFGFMVWLGWRASILYQENQYITRELANQEPVYTKVPVKAYIQDVMPVMQFKPIVSALRKRTQVPSSEVDVDRTIDNALNRDNWLEIVYRQRHVMPEYVVLIDRKSRLDQQARFVQEVLTKLAADGVWLHQYEFSGDPRICFPLDRKDTPLRLKDLQARHPESRLLIFSGTNELINPLTGLLQDWLESLSYWQERAILTPDKLQKVLLEELQARDFVVLPMTFDGLASLVRAFETDNAHLLTNGGVGLPAQLTERPMRWTGRDKPTYGEVNSVVDDVKNYLGENGFYWLCATAVYPELRWELTLHLGSELKDDFGQSLLDPDLLIRLARLPWFRFGYMPDWIRFVLVESFNFQQENQVREVLGNLLSSAYNGQGFDLTFARKSGDSLQKRALRFLNALARNSVPENSLKDYVFLKFIAQNELRKMAVRYPNLLFRFNLFKDFFSIFKDEVFTDSMYIKKVKLTDVFWSLLKLRFKQSNTIIYRNARNRQRFIISIFTILFLASTSLSLVVLPIANLNILPVTIVYLVSALNLLGSIILVFTLLPWQLLDLANVFYCIDEFQVTCVMRNLPPHDKIFIKDILHVGMTKKRFIYSTGSVFVATANKQITLDDVCNPKLVALEINLRRLAYNDSEEIRNEIIKNASVAFKSKDEELIQKVNALLESANVIIGNNSVIRVESEPRLLKVFLCHSSEDKTAVRDLYTQLISNGIDAWLYEKKLLPGQQWKVEIPKAVREADVIIVCLSKISITKGGYVQKEIKLALDTANEMSQGKSFIIPVRLEECDVPDLLSDFHWVNLFEEDGYRHLLKNLRLRATQVDSDMPQGQFLTSDIVSEESRDLNFSTGNENTVQVDSTAKLEPLSEKSVATKQSTHNLQSLTLKGQYFLRSFAGSGGMADVYLAWDTLRSAKMAVKVLRRDLSENPRVLQAFEKEAGFFQDLTHPYIVRFYEFGSEQGILFIVMAWVDGIDLKTRIENLNRPLSLSEVLHILQPICSALSFAHQKRLFHCDIKPSNILLHENGKDVFLANFGIAYMIGEQANGGTLPYMAPEQFTQGVVSPQTDIYSLGIVVYQMLSGGIMPYHGDTKSSGPTVRERYQYEHSYVPLPPLSKFNSKLLSGVFPVIQKATAKKPSERFKSMIEFYNAFVQACGEVRLEQVNTEEDSQETIFEPSFNPQTMVQSQKSSISQSKLKPNTPHLYVRSGDLAGQFIPFFSHELLVGRGANCHIHITEKSVSRIHATIILTKKGAYIRDENSALGTYVNGNRIHPSVPESIRHGDVIQIGYYQVFEIRIK